MKIMWVKLLVLEDLIFLKHVQILFLIRREYKHNKVTRNSRNHVLIHTHREFGKHVIALPNSVCLPSTSWSS